MFILIRGLPGSGKTTYAKKNFKNALLLEPDMYFVRDYKYRFVLKKFHKANQWCFNAANSAVNNGMDVVVTGNFSKAKYVQDYINMCNRYGAPYKVIRMKKQFKSKHFMPKDVFEKMKTDFEDWGNEEIIT